MLTGEIRHQVDRIWDTFWTGGISNPASRSDEQEEGRAQTLSLAG
jgi:hypothetical protein